MATLTELKKYIEGADLLGQLQQDVQQIEGSSVSAITAGYDNLEAGFSQNPEYQDLTKDRFSMVNSFIDNTLSDANTYLSSITLEVAQPGEPAGNYVDLIPGSASIQQTGNSNLAWGGGPDGTPFFLDVNESFTEDDYGYLEANAATLLTFIQDPTASMIVDPAFCATGGNNAGARIGTDWSESGNINVSVNNGDYCAPQGTLSQWAPYIHMSPGDPSALNADVLMG